MAKKIPRSIRSGNLFGKLTYGLTALAVLILAASGAYWWARVHNNPENVFWTMVDNSLRTSGVTRRVQQDDGSQKSDQTVQLQTGAQAVAKAEILRNQQGQLSGVVQTESIATPYDEYVRLNRVDLHTATKKPDFSGVENVWAKSDGDPSQPSSQLYQDIQLGLTRGMLFADLPQAQRRALVQTARNSKTYTTDFSKVKRTRQNGRLVYTYDVEVSAAGYFTLLKQYGGFSAWKNVDTIDPSSYADSAPLSITMEVDVLSGRLTKVAYPTSNGEERFTAYGMRPLVTLPSKTVPINELNQKIQELEAQLQQ
jgi:hypothetical protein